MRQSSKQKNHLLIVLSIFLALGGCSSTNRENDIITNPVVIDKDPSAEDFKNIEIFKATKPYSKNREVELFEMTEKGCQITSHMLYDLLKQMVKKKS